MSELKDWEQIKILTVQINRLRRWHRPGLLCIGDAAHAMSPAGGVGINLAIQDAVAAARLLAAPLKEGRLSEKDLAAVESRRVFPTRITQAIQAAAHRGIARIFASSGAYARSLAVEGGFAHSRNSSRVRLRGWDRRTPRTCARGS